MANDIRPTSLNHLSALLPRISPEVADPKIAPHLEKLQPYLQTSLGKSVRIETDVHLDPAGVQHPPYNLTTYYIDAGDPAAKFLSKQNTRTLQDLRALAPPPQGALTADQLRQQQAATALMTNIDALKAADMTQNKQGAFDVLADKWAKKTAYLANPLAKGVRPEAKIIDIRKLREEHLKELEVVQQAQIKRFENFYDPIAADNRANLRAAYDLSEEEVDHMRDQQIAKLKETHAAERNALDKTYSDAVKTQLAIAADMQRLADIMYINSLNDPNAAAVHDLVIDPANPDPSLISLVQLQSYADNEGNVVDVAANGRVSMNAGNTSDAAIDHMLRVAKALTKPTVPPPTIPKITITANRVSWAQLMSGHAQGDTDYALLSRIWRRARLMGILEGNIDGYTPTQADKDFVRLEQAKQEKESLSGDRILDLLSVLTVKNDILHTGTGGLNQLTAALQQAMANPQGVPPAVNADAVKKAFSEALAKRDDLQAALSQQIQELTELRAKISTGTVTADERAALYDKETEYLVRIEAAMHALNGADNVAELNNAENFYRLAQAAPGAQPDQGWVDLIAKLDAQKQLQALIDNNGQALRNAHNDLAPADARRMMP